MKNIKLALMLALTLAASAHAQDRVQEIVGQTAWVYLDSQGCKVLRPMLLDKPSTVLGTRTPWPESKARFKVLEEVGSAYRVEFDDGSQAFVEGYVLKALERRVHPMYLSVQCVGSTEPQEHARAIAEHNEKEAAFRRESKERKAREALERDELAKRPDAKIGMTAKQVIETSNWGRPDSVNKTATATAIEEQWVYPYGYLYLKNGKLAAIQSRQ